jgi:hypothetical protein
VTNSRFGFDKHAAKRLHVSDVQTAPCLIRLVASGIGFENENQGISDHGATARFITISSIFMPANS